MSKILFCMKCGTKASLDATVCTVCGDVLQSELVAKSQKTEPAKVEAQSETPATPAETPAPQPSQPQEIVLLMPEQEKSLSTPRFITLVTALVVGAILLSLGLYIKNTIVKIQPVVHEVHTKEVVTEYVPQELPSQQPQQPQQEQAPRVVTPPQQNYQAPVQIPQQIPQQAPKEAQPTQELPKVITEASTVSIIGTIWYTSSTDPSVRVSWGNPVTQTLEPELLKTDTKLQQALLGHKVGDIVVIQKLKSQASPKAQSKYPQNCDVLEFRIEITEVK